MKTKDFKTLYENVKLDTGENFEFEISKTAFDILEKLYSPQILYRSIGIVLEDFNPIHETQLSIFGEAPEKRQRENLGKALDKLEAKFGRNIVRTGFIDKEVPFKQGFLTSPQDI